MKSLPILFIVFLIISNNCFAHSWNDAASDVRQKMDDIRTQTQQRDELVLNDEKEILQEYNLLKSQTKMLESEVDALKENLSDLKKQEEKLQQEIMSDGVKNLAGVIQSSIKDTRDLVQKSLAGRSDLDALDKLSPDARFIEFDQFKTLTDILFFQINAGRKITQAKGQFIGADSQYQTGIITIIGQHTAFYKTEDSAGFLGADKNDTLLKSLGEKLPWRVKRAVKAYQEKETSIAPLDLSGGTAARQISQSGSIMDWIKRGGILVWPIIGLAFTALILCLERLWHLRKIPENTDDILKKIRESAENQNWEECQKICCDQPYIPSCNVLKAGILSRSNSRDVMENALEEAVLKELPRLERFLNTLSVLAAIAPLLGLLGTVTGMIHTFQGISSFGTSNPQMMSSGISEALITTQLGLASAIPIMIAHHYFDRRVEKIIGDMEEKGTALMTTLLSLNQAN